MTTRLLLTRRLVQLLIGLFLYGIAIAMMVRAGIGLSPWDVLAQGLSLKTGIPFGFDHQPGRARRAAVLDPAAPAPGARHRPERAAGRPGRAARPRPHPAADEPVGCRCCSSPPACCCSPSRPASTSARGIGPGPARRPDDRAARPHRMADLDGADRHRGDRADHRLGPRRQRRRGNARLRPAGRAAVQPDPPLLRDPAAAGRCND